MQEKASLKSDRAAPANTLGVEGLSTQSSSIEEGADLKLPIEFGRYRLLKQLGAGGMGVVFLAHDTELDRNVALKLPRFTGARSKDLSERFRREARLAATLDHPNICRIFDIGEHQQRLFLTMAFVEGRSLHEIIRAKGAIEPRTAVMLMRRIATTVQFAHSRGIIHRDLKPANIMIKKDRDFVIMDFGLARRVDQEEAQLTTTGAVLGTPAYMAPEQLRGERDASGAQSDVYSLGIILCELLTGERPFQGTLPQIYAQILSTASVTPSLVRIGLDPALDVICQQATGADATRRFKTAEQFATALGQYLTPPSTFAAAAEPPPGIGANLGIPAGTDISLARRSRRRPALVYVGVTTLTLALFGFLAALFIRESEKALAPLMPENIDSFKGTANETEIAAQKQDVSTIGDSATDDRQVDNSINLSKFAITAPNSISPVGSAIREPTGTAVFEVSLNDGNHIYSIDGKECPLVDLESPMDLAAGEHTLIVSLDGQQVFAESFTIATNQRRIIEVMEANRLAIRRVLVLGGSVLVKIGPSDKEYELKPGDPIPAGDLRLGRVTLWDNKNLRDDDMALFTNLNSLYALRLSGTDITDAGIRHLHNHKHLSRLHIGNTRVTEDGLDSLLATMPWLTWLEITNLPVGNRFMKRLEVCPVEKIEAAGTMIGDEGVAHLAGKKLWFCFIENTKITDASLPVIAASAYGYLRLAGTGISDNGLRHFAGARLVELGLQDTSITDIGLAHLRKLAEINRIYLHGTKVTDAGVAAFQRAFPQCKIEK